jgi:16S rRNA (cytidine1402-2'-O)-methyltransferase
MPTLYVVATPIGNMEDISLRALRVLGEVGLIAAEDTRRTRQLLSRYGLRTPLTSYHEHNKKAKLPHILGQLENKDVALVSEAGMPGVSDPGYDLVVACIEQGIPVVPVPGASAIVTALAVSGLPSRQFIYLGFLPRRRGERQRLLESLAPQPRTMVALESPHRLQATLDHLVGVLGDRRVAVCRELTKLHEEVYRGTLSQAREHFSEPRGEFTLVIEGNQDTSKPLSSRELEEELRRLRRQGLSAKEAVARAARATGVPRREAYRKWLELIKSERTGKKSSQ